jgi:hypothetical protein
MLAWAIVVFLEFSDATTEEFVYLATSRIADCRGRSFGCGLDAGFI